MALVDLNSICKNYYYRKAQRETLQGISFSEVKIYVEGGVLWTNRVPQTDRKGPTSVVNVERTDPRLDAYGAVNTSRNNEFVTSVHIDVGRIEGLTKKLSLPLPEEIQNQLGECVEIDISQPVSEARKGFVVEAQTGQQFPHGAQVARAQVTIKDSEYRGSFKCRVAMEGPVIFQLNPIKTTSQEIGEIVDYHNEMNPANADGLRVHRYLHVDGSPRSRAISNLDGVCEFRWMTSQNIRWN